MSSWASHQKKFFCQPDRRAKGRVAVPNRMNFWKSFKGGGVIFNVADFGNFQQGFLSMKLIQKSNFRVQGMFF